MQIDQSQLLCRLYDALVDPVLSYGCQVWGPAVCAELLTHERAVDRKHNPAEGVHVDFLRSACSLPDSSHKWTVLAEYGRHPLLVRWLALAARFWCRVREMDAGRLVKEAMAANISLFLHDRECACWVARFLHCLVSLDCIDVQAVAACTSVEGVWALPIEEEAVRNSLGAWCDGVWSQGAAAAPRDAAAGAVVASTYTQWVWGGTPQGPPPHFTAVLGYHAKCTLMRLRVNGYPLRIATGRNEGSGVSRRVDEGGGGRSGGGRQGPGTALQEPPARGRGIPREQRLCKLCAAQGVHVVEDLQHFLLECPVYGIVKARYPSVFQPPPQSTSVFLGNDDQCSVAYAVCAMLRHRVCCLRG